MDHSGVHASHCCKEHGCKYGDNDCPVDIGTVQQLYACEDCDRDTARLSGAMSKAVELGVILDTPENRAALKLILAAGENAEYE